MMPQRYRRCSARPSRRYKAGPSRKSDYPTFQDSSPSVDSLEYLTRIVHRLIWTVSAQHAAVNFPQIEYASFAPNYPGATYMPPPPICERYHDQLIGEIQPKLDTRNREREQTEGLLPYPYLPPKNIPNSTSV